MVKQVNKVFLVCSLVLVFSLSFGPLVMGQQIAVKRQVDGTITIKSKPIQMRAQISNIVYCRAIEELLKEEKDKLNKLVVENKYEEAKDSIDIIKGLNDLKVEECK